MIKQNNSQKIIQLTQHEHILKKPNVYIGSIEYDNIRKYVTENDKIFEKDIEYNPGLYKIIDEVISNASDHSIENNSCNEIRVNILTENDDIGICVYNNGEDGIKITKTLTIDNKEVYIPELIFGYLLTSSNYDSDKDRITNGSNGLGIKLCNIYSKKFIVEIVDLKNKLKFYQEYNNNMYNREEPIITKTTKINKSSYVKITFYPDLTKFGNKIISTDLINLIHKHMYDISYCCNTYKKVNVYFNDELINIKTLETYMNLYNCDKIFTTQITDEQNNNWELGFSYVPNTYSQISFVNNNFTEDGGTHVNYIVNNIIKELIQKITTKYKKLLIKPAYFHDNLMIFVKCYIKNPSYTSQCKTELKNRITKNIIDITTNKNFEVFIDKISKSGIIQSVIEFAQLKQHQELKKTDGKKTTRVDVDKYKPAQKAGTKDAEKCRLIITEGDSAQTFALRGLEIIGNLYYGVFPIRGKMLNVRNATQKEIANNKEICNIKQILGIKQNEVYTAETIKKLNYGGILILTDQDLDGAHIKGLVINFIHTFWRELVQVDGFFQTVQTPILKAYKKTDKTMSKPIIFYSQVEYNRWRLQNDEKIVKYNIKYYKGLGTSTKDEIQECFDDFKNKLLFFQWEDQKNNTLLLTSSEINTEIDMIDTENNTEIIIEKTESKSIVIKKKKIKDELKYISTISDDAINLAFSKKEILGRKKWLKNYDKDILLEPINNMIPYSDFINKDLIHFSNYDNIRSIPSLLDGLKPSQRKILFTLLDNHIDKKQKEIKVSNLASKVSDKTNYLHGEQSLVGAIINMAQNFVGTNNINLLVPSGEFGSRRLGGDDAAAGRYIFTYLENLVYNIIKQEDNCILKYKEEEGVYVEPENYYPIIPIVLVNGTLGIGTGFSTNIPCYNPIDIIDNLICIIQDKDNVNKLKPWYNNFKGKIEEKNENTFYTFANYEIINKNYENTIKITELPIGVWTEDYITYIREELMKKQEIVKNYTDNSSPTNINIVITFNQGILTRIIRDDELEQKLKLCSIIKTSNMNLHDNDNKLVLYNSPEDILLDFYNCRLEKYNERKTILLKILKNEINIIKYKIQFINDCINKKIIIEKRKKIDIINDLINFKYPKLSNNINAIDTEETELDESKNYLYKSYSYITNLSLFSLTFEQIEKLQKDFDNKIAEYEIYNKTTIKEIWIAELLELKKSYKLFYVKNLNKQFVKKIKK